MAGRGARDSRRRPQRPSCKIVQESLIVSSSQPCRAHALEMDGRCLTHSLYCAYPPLAPGLQDNLALLTASLCANPNLAPFITLLPFGLSATNDTCFIVASDGNLGDGFTRMVCQQQQQQQRHSQKATWCAGACWFADLMTS